MGQIIRCPLVGVVCSKPITIQENSFFLAEAEEPDYDLQRRKKALSEAIADGYKIRSALEEKGINAFTCKICEMIQSCAYGIADISQNNANVFLELGMMLALGKPTIILSKKGQERNLKLPSDVTAIEVVPFAEYLDIIDQLREIVRKLPSPVIPPNPLEDISKIQPQLAEELKKQAKEIVAEFKMSIEEAKLSSIVISEEKRDISPELSKRLGKLEEKLEDLRGLGFSTDADTALLRGNYFFNQAKYEEALASYNWCAELRSNDPLVFNNRGATYVRLERYEEALADYNRSLELKPDDPDTLSNRGVTYSKLEKYEEALADYNHSLELKPDDPATLDNRGVNYSKLGRHEEALADCNRSLELKPDNPLTLHNLACLFSLGGKAGEALAYLEKAIDKDDKYREMAKTDEDFDSIRDAPRFRKLIE